MQIRQHLRHIAETKLATIFAKGVKFTRSACQQNGNLHDQRETSSLCKKVKITETPYPRPTHFGW
jgi:hypothetical protein